MTTRTPKRSQGRFCLRFPPAALALTLAASLGMPTGSAAAVGRGVTRPVNVSDPRPLAAAADQLQQQYGIAICYEDPPFSHPDDLKPAATKPIGGVGSEKPVMVPAGTGLVMSLNDAIEGASGLDPATILTSLVQKYADEDQPGRFQVQARGKMFHITPTQVRQGKGELAAVTPLLDTPITLPTATRQATVALRQIKNRLRNASGINVRLGAMPSNLLYRSAVTVGGTDVPARDLLSQLSEALPTPVTWRLLWDANLQSYYLNLAAVGNRNENVLFFRPASSKARPQEGNKNGGQLD